MLVSNMMLRFSTRVYDSFYIFKTFNTLSQYENFFFEHFQTIFVFKIPFVHQSFTLLWVSARIKMNLFLQNQPVLKFMNHK